LSGTGARPSARLAGGPTILLVLLAALETVGFVFHSERLIRYPRLVYFDIDRYVDSLSQETLDANSDPSSKNPYAPDPALGWIRKPSSQHTFDHGTTTRTDASGSRIVPGASGPTYIQTYGDSFTEGLEVEDGRTWQAFLARATGTSILNFGVSGYGPDQALLALEANLERGLRTPVVVLAMIEENLNRIMNSFRLFYTYPTEDMFLAFKPVFEKVSGSYQALRFSPSDRRDREEIRRALWRASEHDSFYAGRTERVEFSHFLNAVRFLSRYGLSAPPEPGRSEAANERMAYILERFQNDARVHGFTPVLLLLPQSEETLRQRRGADHPRIAPLVAPLERKGLIYIDVEKELSGDARESYVPGFRPEEYVRITHPSAYGNEAIAAVTLAKLRDSLASFPGRAP
jgi:hypothetical protein